MNGARSCIRVRFAFVFSLYNILHVSLELLFHPLLSCIVCRMEKRPLCHFALHPGIITRTSQSSAHTFAGEQYNPTAGVRRLGPK